MKGKRRFYSFNQDEVGTKNKIRYKLFYRLSVSYLFNPTFTFSKLINKLKTSRCETKCELKSIQK